MVAHLHCIGGRPPLTLSGTVSNLLTLLEEYLQSDQPIKLKRINLLIAETEGIGESSVFAKVAA